MTVSKKLFWIYTLASLLGNIYILDRLHRAEICNKAFVLWFHHNLGVNINLDYFYQDAKKWVNDPQYQ